ncbi:hypothetical protein ACRE_037830 [Hapsidospora chrysogenum ATCC 11550]|uniref:CST complex subunit Stn1 N-terminal domain-containing protein n=1 Tax=Hapsidospora chrysogenum (strain ATCC 11550 / CBS 779.69 / DSM 880 / IAM 14645 / JCM 23072 / IMI 49137) TaxID=857340 RepID=A0A086T7T3_HAPC1|nr:hypothetical protein ACRE_037830 [Hapsidospora chrysogenum ATCC 11550]
MSGAPRPALYPRCCFHLSPTFNVWCLLRAADIQSLDQHAGFEGTIVWIHDFYFHRNLPIRWVRIVGVVVAVDEFSGRRVFMIDDSSGVCIESVTAYTPPPNPDKAVEASTNIVGASGGQSSTDGAKQQQQQQPQLATYGQPATNDAKQPSAQQQPPQLPYEEIDVGAVVDVKGKLTTFRGEMQITIEKMAHLKGTAQEVTLWEKRAKFRREVLDQPWILTDREVRRCRKEAERSATDFERNKKRIKEAVARAASHADKPWKAGKELERSEAERSETDAERKKKRVEEAAHRAAASRAGKPWKATTKAEGPETNAERKMRRIKEAAARAALHVNKPWKTSSKRSGGDGEY